jgi:hypothetical protein
VEGEAMKIQFEVTIEDLVSLTAYYCEKSKMVKRTKMLVLWGSPLVVFMICSAMLISMFIEGEDNREMVISIGLLSLVVFGAYAAVWFFIWPIVHKKSIVSRARKLYSEGSATGAVGTQELELTETVLIARSPSSETYTRLSTIEKVVNSGDYTYIFLNSFTANVIPHDAVIAGDLTEFIEALKRRISVDRA